MSSLKVIWPRVSTVRLAGFFLWVMALALVPPARAQGQAGGVEDEAEGRRLFKRGQELFVEGRYLEAAQTFEAGYAAAPRSAFLINIAHAYRRAGELHKAKSYYQRLLEVEPNTPQRPEVEANIRSIDDALMLENLPPAPAPPTPQKVPVPDAEEAFRKRVAQEDAALVSRDFDAPAEDGGSVFGKAWFWALLLSAAAGAGITAFLLTRSETGCPYDECYSESSN